MSANPISYHKVVAEKSSYIVFRLKIPFLTYLDIKTPKKDPRNLIK
jgi:hypothetical protein